MADHFYAVSLPGAKFAGATATVTKGTSTNSGNFELRVTDGVTGMSKVEIQKGLEVLLDFIVTDSAPA